MKYLRDYMDENNLSWIEMQKDYLLNPQKYRELDLMDQVEAQSGSGGLAAAALMIACDRLSVIIDMIESKI